MASTPPIGDPRLSNVAPASSEAGIAPRVALSNGGPSWLVLSIGMIAFGLLLFTILDARRRSAAVPAVRMSADDQAASAVAPSPPPLYVPPPLPTPEPVVIAPAEPPRPPPPPPQIIYVPQPIPQPQPVDPLPPPPRASGGPALVFDGTAGTSGDQGATAPAGSDSAANSAGPASGSGPAIAGSRARAGVLANRGNTVPQGTLIPAVLETGLDSTRPGLARAIVSRDVRGFDGKSILIARGSRLIGEYRSDAQQGQKRALVNWLRLIRPDGVTIAIGSPASDPLGRGGINAKVNDHFFTRFSGAILQSALDIGVNLASRSTGSPVIVALPGLAQNVAQPLAQRQEIAPTLTVKPGTSITIFVARDLDFTGAENRK